MGKERRDISTPEKLSEYLNNLNLNLPGSMFRRMFIDNPESGIRIGDLEHTKKMIGEFGDIFSTHFLNITYKEFYKEIDDATREVGYSDAQITKIHKEWLEAMRGRDMFLRDKKRDEFNQILLRIHDELLKKGFNHYEIVA